MDKQLICITCPNGCPLKVTYDESSNLLVTGNKCPRGIDFAKMELTAPKRSLTTTVKTSFSHLPYLPVQTKGEVPKEMIPECMKVLADITVKKKVMCGDVILKNIANTGVSIIATLDI